MTKLDLFFQIMGLMEGIVRLDPEDPEALATPDDLIRVEQRLTLILRAFAAPASQDQP
jgi:hypothetical protein